LWPQTKFPSTRDRRDGWWKGFKEKNGGNIWWLQKNPPLPFRRDGWWTGLKKGEISGGSWRIPPLPFRKDGWWTGLKKGEISGGSWRISPLSPLQKRWVVNRVKEGGNIWWLLKNPPSPFSEEMGGEQG
jgi:hypothetical protein